jgi:hypothetical protein
MMRDDMAPHIRIFPHARKEFSSCDTLTTWLLTGLKARGGKYLLVSRDAVAELPPGSLVLFRYRQVVVGEAVVIEYSRDSSVNRNLAGDDQEYGACVWFSLSSIRVYAPPVGIKKLQEFIGESQKSFEPRGPTSGLGTGTCTRDYWLTLPRREPLFENLEFAKFYQPAREVEVL